MTDFNLRVCTFNCCSLTKNIDLIRELATEKYDIICLQETFITEDKLGILDYVDENYESIGVPAAYSEKALTANAGRPEGGMAVLWRRNSNFTIKKVSLEKNFMMIKVRVSDKDILLVNVYLNSDIWEIETLNKYLESLSKLESLLDDEKFDSIYFTGDFNADPVSGRAWQNLSNFMNNNHLKCFDVEELPQDTFTFIGYGNSQSRWLDHLIGIDSSFIDVHSIKVLSGINGSDHLPMEFSLKFANIQSCKESNYSSPSGLFQDYINWKHIRPVEIKKMNEQINCAMKNFYEMSELCCLNLGCRKADHIMKINQLYKFIVSTITRSSEQFKKRSIRKDKFKVIPGWNRNVKSLHTRARLDYLEWIGVGRPMDTSVHHFMLNSRKEFKTALNNCKLNEHKEICKSIIEKFQSKNFREFWNNVRRQKASLKRTNIINGEIENKKIVKIFADKFFPVEEISTIKEVDFLKKFKERWPTDNKMNLTLSLPTLKKLISSLSLGCGHDGIHSVFLKNADDIFLNNLARFLNICFSHCYLPCKVLIGTVNPTIKDIKGNITDAANYRPVMQSSCILKIFELHVLNVLSEKLQFNERQFGFRKGLSTTDNCFLLKEVIYEYSKSKRSGIATFVDLSKAFDNVDHFLLGDKLLESKVPIDIVYIIMHYLRNQSANVVWKDASSKHFFIESGVRQGGILSPLLFKFYINSIINDISSMNEGCALGISKVNILAYADDIVLIAGSVREMERLYEQLCFSIREHRLNINKEKSKCMFFSSSVYRNCPNTIELGADVLEVVSCYKYLGHWIESTLSDVKDIQFTLNKFYATTNSVIRNFKNVDMDTLLFLFDSYCKPVYGLCLWNNRTTAGKCIFKTFEVAFNNILKRILRVPMYASSHITAERCSQLLLRHHIALLQASYFNRIFKSSNLIIKLNKPFLRVGYFSTFINRLFSNVYDVNIAHHATDILASRIGWVQRHEPRRGPCLYFMT